MADTIEASAAIALVLLTVAGIALSHVWQRESHTYWAHRPWIRGLGIANWYHVASFLSYWPICAWVTYYHIPLRLWLVLPVGAAIIWWIAKRGTGWMMWWIQIYRRYRVDL